MTEKVATIGRDASLTQVAGAAARGQSIAAI
jgi:hypothetical protein